MITISIAASMCSGAMNNTKDKADLTSVDFCTYDRAAHCSNKLYAQTSLSVSSINLDKIISLLLIFFSLSIWLMKHGPSRLPWLRSRCRLLWQRVRLRWRSPLTTAARCNRVSRPWKRWRHSLTMQSPKAKEQQKQLQKLQVGMRRSWPLTSQSLR